MQFFLVASTEPLKFVLVGCSRFHGNANISLPSGPELSARSTSSLVLTFAYEPAGPTRPYLRFWQAYTSASKFRREMTFASSGSCINSIPVPSFFQARPLVYLPGVYVFPRPCNTRRTIVLRSCHAEKYGENTYFWHARWLGEKVPIPEEVFFCRF